MTDEIPGGDILLIEEHLDLENRIKDSRKKFYRLIRHLASQGVNEKVLARHCKLTRQRINDIIHKTRNPGCNFFLDIN